MTVAFPTAVKRADDALSLFIHHIVHGKSTCPFNPCPVANFLLISKYEEINLEKCDLRCEYEGKTKLLS
jgi:hypothetical protein